MAFPGRMDVAAMLLGLVAVLVAPAAVGQDVLYGPQPPAGSAYLRFANGLPTDVTITPHFMAVQRLGSTATQRIGPYTVVDRVGGRSLPFEVGVAGHRTRSAVHVEPGSFVTVILQPMPDGHVQTVTVRDKTEFNQVRTALSFYNTAPDCPAASLRLDPAGSMVFQDVAPGTAASRDVTPVDAQLRAACGEDRAAPFALTGLESGARFSIWLVRAGKTVTAFAQRDTVTRYKP